jgi:hypothetical protein
MFSRKINPAVLFAALTLGAMAVVYWATWSALPHHTATGSAAVTNKVVPVEVLGLLSWGITAAYGAWLAVTGRKAGNVPRNLTGRPLRAFGAGELVLSLLAVWAILTQPASTFLYTFGVVVGIFTVGIGATLALRERSSRSST